MLHVKLPQLPHLGILPLLLSPSLDYLKYSTFFNQLSCSSSSTHFYMPAQSSLQINYSLLLRYLSLIYNITNVYNGIIFLILMSGNLEHVYESKLKLSVNHTRANLSSMSDTVESGLPLGGGERRKERKEEREKPLTTQRGTTKCITDASSGIGSWPAII